MKIVLATHNRGKLREIDALLCDLPVELVSAADLDRVPEVEEDADTLEGNAQKKAVAIFAAIGIPALADDTGLEVEALGGRPGVHSARYASEKATDKSNRARLLDELGDATDRTARFRTVLAYVDATGTHYFEGICRGTITSEERGEGGFGYDSVFVPEGEERTFAEMPASEKNAISHRGRALDKFRNYLREHLESFRTDS